MACRRRDSGRIGSENSAAVRFGCLEEDFVDGYRDIARALISDNDENVMHYAEQIGYMDPDVSPAHAWRLLEMIQLICEPIRKDAVYDFASSDLTVRARDAGMEMMMKSRMDELKTPPPETVFLHRKLVGSFLLCARIRARVDMRGLLEPFLDSGVES